MVFFFLIIFPLSLIAGYLLETIRLLRLKLIQENAIFTSKGIQESPL